MMNTSYVKSTRVPMKVLSHYRTFTKSGLRKLQETKKNFLRKKTVSSKEALELTEYLIISGQMFRGPLYYPSLHPVNKETGIKPAFRKLSANFPMLEGIMPCSSVDGLSRSLGFHYPLKNELPWPFTGLIMSKLKGGKSILDIGAGSCLGAIEHARTHPERSVVALEPNAMNITRAYRYLHERGLIKSPLDNLNIILGDANSDIQIPSFSADLVILSGVLPVSPSLSKKAGEIMAGAIKWLSPSGSMLIVSGHIKEARNIVYSALYKAGKNLKTAIFYNSSNVI